MKHLQIFGLVLVASLASGAILASIATAETTLLAEWEVGGATFSGTLATEIKGSTLLEDTSFKIGITCEGTIDGSVTGESSGVGTSTKVLSKAGVEIGEKLSGTALECTRSSGCESSSTPLTWPVNLPWHYIAYLLESGTYADHIFGEAGYEVECTVLLSKISEECKDASGTGTGVDISNSVSGVEIANEDFLPDANCTTGGTGTGVNLPSAGTTIVVTGGGVLAICSE
jgi:hypothetical protein